MFLKYLNSIPTIYFILLIVTLSFLLTPETFVHVSIFLIAYFIFIRSEFMDANTNSDSYGNDINFEYIDDQL